LDVGPFVVSRFHLENNGITCLGRFSFQLVEVLYLKCNVVEAFADAVLFVELAAFPVVV